MNKENYSTDNTKEDKRSKAKEKEPFPPEKSKTKFWLLPFIFLLSFYIVEQFCSLHDFSWLTIHFPVLGKEIFRPCIWGTYLALGTLLTLLLWFYLIEYKYRVHKARLVDRSIVEGLIVEAKTIEPRFDEPNKRPENFKKKEEDLKGEVARLEELGFNGCTEYQVLSINQLLLDFVKADELKSRVLSNLSTLKGYAKKEEYNKWEDPILKLIKKIDKTKDGKNYNLKQDTAAEPLRLASRTLLDDIADYDSLWAKGSTILTDIRICCTIAIFPIVTMGLLSILHPAGDKVIGILNWGMLGISGAITAVLWSLRKSNSVDVGDEEGKKEFWRALLGAGLGFVAGILLYSMIAGEILNGKIFPDVISNPPKESGFYMDIDIALSIFWGIASGFSLELVFGRLSSTSELVSS